MSMLWDHARMCYAKFYQLVTCQAIRTAGVGGGVKKRRCSSEFLHWRIILHLFTLRHFC